MSRVLISSIVSSRQAGAIVTTDYEVTVPLGKVGSDLTGFPLMIDLADMPIGFWSLTRDDGGNIRVYEADGETMIPHDVTYVNKRRSLGRMFVRVPTLASASDTVLVIKLYSPVVAALSVSNTNGRNGVWADYEVVWVFPEDVNRTGKSYVNSVSALEPHTEWIKTSFRTLTGSPHQGVATDGTVFISVDTNAIRKMNMSFTVTASDLDVSTSLATPIPGVDHLGDPVIIGTKFYLTATTTTAGERFIVEFNLSDLSYSNHWVVVSPYQGFGATVCYDGTNLILSSYGDGSKLVKYTTAGVFVGVVTLSTDIGAGIQGSTVLPDGNIFLSLDNLGGRTGSYLFEVEPDGTVLGNIYTDPNNSFLEGMDYDDTTNTLYLNYGDGDLISLKNHIDQVDWRKIHFDLISCEVTTTTQAWTMATSVHWAVSDGDLQQSFMSVANDASDRVSFMYDEGPDELGVWDSNNSWLRQTGANPAGYDTFRLSASYNNTGNRRIFIDGTMDIDTSITAKPATGDGTMDFILNASNLAGTDEGEAYYQAAWLRYTALNGDWLSADAANVNNPSTFYTITTV